MSTACIPQHQERSRQEGQRHHQPGEMSLPKLDDVPRRSWIRMVVAVSEALGGAAKVLQASIR